MLKYLISVSLIAISCAASKVTPKPKPVERPSAGVNYIMYFKTNGELGVVSYRIQQSTNNSNWTTIGTPFNPKLLPDSNRYSVTLPTPKTSRYFRLMATMVNGTYVRKPIYVKITK